MSKTQAMTAFRIIFMLLWFVASEIKGNSVPDIKFNRLWIEAHALMEE